MITVKIESSLIGKTDDEIRKIAKEEMKNHNGEYISSICRCGSFTTNPEASTENAKILNQCKFCFKEK